MLDQYNGDKSNMTRQLIQKMKDLLNQLEEQIKVELQEPTELTSVVAGVSKRVITFYDDGTVRSSKLYNVDDEYHSGDVSTPSCIFYHTPDVGGVSQTQFHQNGILHRGNDLPAITQWNTKGQVISKHYYNEGRFLRWEDFEEEIQADGSILSLKRTFNSHGDMISAFRFNKNGRYHSPTNDTPAFIKYFDNGTPQREEYYKDGKLHRSEGKPAVIIYDRTEGEVLYKYYKDGYNLGEEDRTQVEL